MVIDPTTNIGRVRLRVADYGDIPLLPDSVYDSTLTDTNQNLPKTAAICAQYILGMLSSRVHRKLQQLEVYGSEYFKNYKDFLMLTVLNPNQYAGICPLPYQPKMIGEHPLIQFQKDWNRNYIRGTQSQQLHFDAQVGNLFNDERNYILFDANEIGEN